MTGERWARITAVFHAALEKPERERNAFLDEACGGDDSLRRTVERLLAGEAEPSLESPLPELLKTGALELTSGETLAQYRVEAKIGEGGMGVVYRSYDTRLQRKVALKVLAPERFADLERKRRLVREARAASGLNHPNIVTIYEIGADRGVDFIAMEYVEGKRLDELIPARGLRPVQVLRYAVQIADASARAHGAGILHRDLKPSNIMVTAEGRVKLLDFGLAKVLEPADSSPDAPTATLQRLTEEGTVVGTAAYMSPEQAEGRKLDARSDIFSFGTVLYEMVTGSRPFAADTRLSLLTKIVNEEPRPPSQFAAVSADLEKLILRCLRKDPARRYQTMADLKVALEDLETETSRAPVQASTAPSIQAASARRSITLRKIALFAAAILAAVTIVFIATRVFQRSPEGAPLRTIKFTITPANLVRGSDYNTDSEVSISRDGKHIAYVESQGGQLWIRDIDQEQARIVPGATGVYQAFWSPDNQSIGYSARGNCGLQSGCDLVRIPVQGGTPVLIVKLQGAFRRAFWSSDGETIVYCDTTGMYTVPARGGSPTRIIEHTHIEHPSFVDLPGGRRAILYQTGGVTPGAPDHAIWIRIPGEDQSHRIAISKSINPYPAYSPTGHIIYVDGAFESTAIWAVPFSLDKLQITGKPFPIAQHGGSPVVSLNGTLVYGDVPSDRKQLAWVDRSGASLGTIGEPQRQDTPLLSPDGHKLAIEVREGDPDIWVYDLNRGIKTRFTSDPAGEFPAAWSLSGELLYSSTQSGALDILSKPSSGNREAALLVGTPLPERALDWSPDQRYLLYGTFSPETKGDVLYRELRKDGSVGEPAVFLKTPFTEIAARFSPDGRFVVYCSDDSGQLEVYVRDFPSGTNKWQISANGGYAPRWTRDGREILYVERSRLMAVSVTSRPALAFGAPARLFERTTLRNQFPEYDVSADGKRFVILDKPAGEPPLSIHVVHNWFEEFRGQPGR